MTNLSNETLRNLATDVTVPGYDRSKVKAGIVHLGIGNFHRAHQAVYCDDLLKLGLNEWGIVGVSMRSSATREALIPQDSLYTIVSLDQNVTYRVIGSLTDVLVAPKETDNLLAAIASSDTKVITVTVTEKGYCLKNGFINPEHPHFLADMTRQHIPATAYGFLAAGLRERAAADGLPLTVISCDNVSAGGLLLEEGVHRILEAQDSATAEWVCQNISFVSSVVDRIVPVTTETLIQRVRLETGIDDAWPVPAETFSQWYIEDRFKSVRPPFNRVGAKFVSDLAPYERMKLRLLNAGHSIIASIGYLMGCEFIHEVMTNITVRCYMEDILLNEILPVTPLPTDVDGMDYIRVTLNRFANKALPYAVHQVATDSSQKLAVRLFPTIDNAISSHGSTYRLNLALAMWLNHIRQASLALELNDPLSEAFYKVVQASKSYGDLARDVLALAGAEKFLFFGDMIFMDSLAKNLEALALTKFDLYI